MPRPTTMAMLMILLLLLLLLMMMAVSYTHLDVYKRQYTMLTHSGSLSVKDYKCRRSLIYHNNYKNCRIESNGPTN